jgi:hypothetical protein
MKKIKIAVLFIALLAACVCPAATNSITLEWSENTDLDLAGYYVYAGTNSGVYFQRFDAGESTTYTITGLDCGRPYFFAVTAYTASHFEGEYSDEVVMFFPGPPAKVRNLRVKAVTQGVPTTAGPWGGYTNAPAELLNFYRGMLLGPVERPDTR